MPVNYLTSIICTHDHFEIADYKVKLVVNII